VSDTSKIEELYSAVEESARVLDLACSRDQVWPVLAAFADGLADAMFVLSMAGGEGHRAELDYNFTILPGRVDPYTVAVANGFTAATDHPVGALLSDIRERCTLQFYGVESGVVSGFKKTWAFFPLDNLQGLSKLTDIPSMPRSVAEHAGTFARYDLDNRISIVGIDYLHKTMNVYFGRFPTAEYVEPETVRSLLRDLGLPEPSEPMLEFVRNSFSIYPTFSWDSSEIERICFSVVTTDATALPARLAPEIARFTRSAPYAYDGDRIIVYGATLSASEEYYKAGVYYQRPLEVWNNLQLFDKVVDRA
jgi:hypothetical protein